MISVFVSYSHKDDAFQAQLQVSLSMLKRQGIIDVWHDRRIVAGDDVDVTISDALEEARVILLLVSPDFLASDYCYDREMKRAMERHEAGEARVIPVIVRPCDWHGAPFGKLLAAPTDGKPISTWPNVDEAYLDVVKAVRVAVDVVNSPEPGAKDGETLSASSVSDTGPAGAGGPRSSNLRVRRQFTEADKDMFLDDTFEYIARFFENSLAELDKRNPDIKTAYKRIDAHRFEAVIYRDGDAMSRCRIFLGGFGGRGSDSIMYSNADHDFGGGNSYNESLSIDVGEQLLGLKPMTGGLRRGEFQDRVLTQEGAAEFYWEMLIEPLQT